MISVNWLVSSFQAEDLPRGGCRQVYWRSASVLPILWLRDAPRLEDAVV